MIETLLGNPIMLVAVIIGAILIGKLFKWSLKALKWIILLVLAYVIISKLGIF